ncbi:MAG: FAD-dependent monooxygenase [Sphingobium sp.]|nr:FAD-dependent monooxygenase [Sphingobium sp.]
MRQPNPIIVGAGPAGCAAALRLARVGGRPLLIDRDEQAGDALCGGFLSWATLARLRDLGLPAEALGGQRIGQVALFAGGHEVRLGLPAPGMGLSRRRLDSLLRMAAGAAGAELRLGRAAWTLSPDRLTLDDGLELGWDSLFLATGKHDLRGVGRPHRGGDPELGLRLTLGGSATLDRLIGDRIELHMVAGGYVGVLRQEGGRANICMAVRKSRLALAGGRPRALLAELADRHPALADRLADLPADAQIDAIGHVPYGWRARATWPGLYRLGDQAAAIPSLAGEGIGIALASAQQATDRWLKEGRGGAVPYQRALARDARLPLAAAAAFRALGRHPPLMRALAAIPGAAGIAMRLTRIATP